MHKTALKLSNLYYQSNYEYLAAGLVEQKNQILDYDRRKSINNPRHLIWAI